MEERKEEYETRLDGSIATGYNTSHFSREMLIESPSVIHKEKNVGFHPLRPLFDHDLCPRKSRYSR